jgi:hypothetical protein
MVMAALLLAAGPLLTSCATFRTTHRIPLEALERAAVVAPTMRSHMVVSDLDVVAPLHQRLTDGLGLIQVHNLSEWRILQRAVPYLGPPPDFSRGSVVGLLISFGTPVDGSFPLDVRSVRTLDGAGLLAADVPTESFLPDHASYLELLYVEGLRATLVVDLDTIRFFPD